MEKVNKISKVSEKEIPDSAIINEICAGKKEMFGTLMQRYQSRLLGFFYRMTRSLEESQDLTQETFINVYFNLHKFDRTKDFYPWLFTIANHLAVNSYYQRSKIRLIDIEKVPALEDGHDMFEQTVKQESREMVRSKLEKIKLQYRTILELRYLKEKSYTEIAQYLNLPINTVKSRLFRAKSFLAKIFNQAA